MSRKRNKYSRRTSTSLKKKKVVATVIIVVTAILVLIAAAIGMGAYLRHKAEAYEPENKYQFDGNTPPPGSGTAAEGSNLSYTDQPLREILSPETFFSSTQS